MKVSLIKGPLYRISPFMHCIVTRFCPKICCLEIESRFLCFCVVCVSKHVNTDPYTGSPNVVSLRGEVFIYVSEDFMLMSRLYSEVDDMEGVYTLIRACCDESVASLRKCYDLNDEEYQLMVKSMPVSIQCSCENHMRLRILIIDIICHKQQGLHTELVFQQLYFDIMYLGHNINFCWSFCCNDQYGFCCCLKCGLLYIVRLDTGGTSYPTTGVHSTDAVYIRCSVQLFTVLLCIQEWC